MSGPTPVVQRATLAVVCVATAILMLDIAVVNTALPSIGRDLHAGITGLKWVVDIYTLTLATAVLGAGSWADRSGRRRAFALGLIVFTAASAACAFAPSLAVLNAARAVQGVGAAVLFACSLALLAHAFPAGAPRTGALAAYGATIGASFAVGPLVGGALTEYLDWRAIFLINVPIGIACLLATLKWVNESRNPSARGADWPGQILAAASLGLLVFALIQATTDGWGSAPVLGSLAGAAVAGIAFLAVEQRSASPMVPITLFRDRGFTGAQVSAFAISSSLFAIFLYVTLYLQGVLRMSPVETGLVYLPGTIVMFVVAGATAQMSQRCRPVVLIFVSLLMVAAGLLLILAAGPHSSWPILMPGTILAFAGSGIFNPVMSGLVIGAGTDEHSALAAGVNDAFRQTGIALGVAALGTLFPSGAAITPASFTHGLHLAAVVSAAIAVAGAIAAALLIRQPAPAEVEAAERITDNGPVRDLVTV